MPVSPGRDRAVGGVTVSEPAAPRDGAPARLERMRRAFAEALDRYPGAVYEHCYAFAGRPVRLRVVGSRLAERSHRAFAHLRRHGVDSGQQTLQIDLWDETETGVPGLPDAASTELDRQWVACDGTITASPDGRYVSFRYEESVTVLDRQAQQMVSCRRSGSHLSSGDCSKPFVLMLSIWYHDRGVQLLHSGLIARNGAGILLPGASGTGKSTTSLAGVAQGFEFLGDDFVGLERGQHGTFLGHSVFNTVCLVRENLARFPDIRPYAVEDSFEVEEKPILYLSEIYPERLRATVPVRAVVLLRTYNARTEICRAGRAEALRQFAASTLHTVVPRPGREALERIRELVERVPAYWLLLGPDLQDIALSLDAVLASAGAGAP
jgi:hypothetical protein